MNAAANPFLEQIRGTDPILPSLLLCDFGNLSSEIARVEAAGVRALHLDVMDGHFVPNFTYGMTIVRAVRSVTNLPLDVHLMITSPGRYLQAFREAGADHLTIHAEATENLVEDLRRIRQLGASAGVAVNPSTPIEEIRAAVGLVDLVLIMSVEAGFGGQSFRRDVLPKFRQARDMFGPDVLLQIDGGIDRESISPSGQAGAQLFVVGAAIFRTPDYRQAVRELVTRLPGSASALHVP